jgi:hypothetical protein
VAELAESIRKDSEGDTDGADKTPPSESPKEKTGK